MLAMADPPTRASRHPHSDRRAGGGPTAKAGDAKSSAGMYQPPGLGLCFRGGAMPARVSLSAGSGRHRPHPPARRGPIRLGARALAEGVGHVENLLLAGVDEVVAER